MKYLLVPGLLLAAYGLMGHVQRENEDHGGAGAVYTMTNDGAGNSVVMFRRFGDGSLARAGEFRTGGLGSGGGLGNQGSLALSDSERWLFAVNAGSSELSVFAVRNDGLELTDKHHSGGVQPISVTSHGDVVYVLNEASGSISGFRVSARGKLSPIPGSMRPLGIAGADPAQIGFHPSGRVLLVTVKNTNQILTFRVDHNGMASPAQVHPSAGMTPFGFEFGKRGQVVISEAAGGVANASSASSYEVMLDGRLRRISAAVPAGGTAACWVTVTRDGRFAFTSNSPSDSISTFRIGFDGSLRLAGTMAAGAGTRPLDSALSNNSRYLYVLNSGNGTLSGFRVEEDGGLVKLQLAPHSLPGSANGLAAR